MLLVIHYQPYVLNFNFEAGTSRGVLREKKTWFLRLTDKEQPGVTGYGECGPLPGLSVDDRPDFETKLIEICQLFNSLELEVFPFNLPIILEQVIPLEYPSIRFGIEMALYDFMNGGNRRLFDTDFIQNNAGIEMNGLVWMGSEEFMNQQIQEKIDQGFSTIKIKVGAIDFEKECTVLASLRERFPPQQITLRVDANGAFTEQDVEDKLARLSCYAIHSIEQPIDVGQHALMKTLVDRSPIPVALDEELIGPRDYMQKFALLKALHPPYIILKPTLLGGFQQCTEWIEIAQRLSIRWWITSALESNLGLNAIAQYTAQFETSLPQGLGTGQIYANNFPSPLTLRGGRLHSQSEKEWDLSLLSEGWQCV